MKILTALVVLSLLTTFSGQSKGQSTSNILARVGDLAITESDVRGVAAKELDNIEMKKMQLEATFARDKQNLYERAVSNLIDSKIVELEASKRGVSPQAFVATEVDRRAGQGKPGDNNQSAAPGTTPAYLNQRSRTAAYQELIKDLREEYNVKTYLEKLRTSVPTEGSPAKGASKPRVTIVEFADFECPFCVQLSRTLQEILKNYGDKVQLVYRQFPLRNLHANAHAAAEASLCANDQNKFWEMHDALFQSNALDLPALKKTASTLGMDLSLFGECLDGGRHSTTVLNDIRDGVKAGVASTPTLFINGKYFEGARPYNELAKIIEEELRQTTTESSKN